MTEQKYCCGMFEASVLHKMIWRGATWLIDTGLDGDIVIDYCPFCGKKIGNHYEFILSRTVTY